MIVVIVDKTFIDSNRSTGKYAAFNTAMPDDRPLNVREEEWPNMAAAQAANVGKTLMTVQAYNALQLAYEVSHKGAIDQMMLDVVASNAANKLLTDL